LNKTFTSKYFPTHHQIEGIGLMEIEKKSKDIKSLSNSKSHLLPLEIGGGQNQGEKHVQPNYNF
jgi:hypothetical protein